MKNLIFIFALLLSCNTLLAQQKKNTKQFVFPVPEIKKDIETTTKCFVYDSEIQKDSLVYVTKNLLEYGWSGNSARMFITTFDYDPLKKKAAEKKGLELVQAELTQLIDGTYKIEKNILTFTAKDKEDFKSKTFRLVYKPKSQKIDYLKDENNNKYIVGGCHLAVPSIGM